ncbi:MAG: GTP-binding protein [Oscillospiraceae bacterium]|nr:GTP-binding protein [Oscillospiraceae bacterium]
MTKVDIFSGFLGAGKTTLIKKLIAEAYQGQKLVLIENEFGEIGIDGGFMAEAGIQVNELNSGCICCSLVGDFSRALKQVVETYHPDRILIEPSGVGKLSDIIRAVAEVEGMEVNSATAIADAVKCKRYIKNFGEFYDDQIKHAGAIVLSRTGGISPEKLDEALALLRERNSEAVIITTPWDELNGAQIVEAIERTDTLEKELEELSRQPRGEHEHHHHHHDHDHDDENEDEEEHEHHHHDHDHDHDGEEHEHHHHHDHDHDGEEHEHHHHHDHDHHHHHHDHDADEVFTSWGVETAKKFTETEVRDILEALDQAERFGAVLRAKGIVDASDGGWLHFDHVPGEADVRRGPAGVTGRLCVIGSELKEDALRELFGV